MIKAKTHNEDITLKNIYAQITNKHLYKAKMQGNVDKIIIITGNSNSRRFNTPNSV